MSATARWALWIALAAGAGIVAAVFLDRGEPLAERVLARTPPDASITAYAEMDSLRQSDVLGPLLRERLLGAGGFSIVEPEVDALAVAVGSREIVGVAAGRFPAALVRAYLEQKGAICPGPLDESACSMPGAYGGYLSLRAVGPGLVGLVHGPRPNAADDLAGTEAGAAGLAGAARAALDEGALVWIRIEPRRLAETMSDPPEGWINLSLIARALLSAEEAAVLLRDGDEGAVEATLRARCGSATDAEELAKMLESLNKLAAKALSASSDQRSQEWAGVLEDGFRSEASANDVTVRWRLPAEVLERAFRSEP
jgi:hypothetical protein